MKHPNTLRFRSLTIAVAVAAVCQSVSAVPTASPFASVPPNLVKVDEGSSAPTVKPRVMLLVDDSGSMDTFVRGTRTTRMQVVKEALNELVAKKGDTLRWNVMTLWGSHNGARRAVYPAPNEPADTTGQYLSAAEMPTYINRMRSLGRTPTTESYLLAAEYAQKAIRYACQKNYIVFLSDGDANEGGPKSQRGMDYYAYFSKVYGSSGFNPFAGLYYRGYWPWSNINRRYDYLNMNDPNNGIAPLSHALLNNDLIPDGYKGGPAPLPAKAQGGLKDAEGNPWDGDQNIETFAVGFGGDMSDAGEAYLRHAGASKTASQTYFDARTSKDLVDAFNTIFDNIKPAEIKGVAASSTATPTNASSTNVDGAAAGLSLDTTNWSSNLVIYGLNADGSLNGNNHSASYGGRTVIVNNGSRNSILSASDYALFGFGNNRAEFADAFLPWYTRSATVDDAQAEQNAVNAAKRGAARVVSAYRQRDRSRPWEMGDVLDANTLSIGAGAKYIITGANDGMVYMFKKSGKDYNLAVNYLPATQPRESDSETLGTVVPTIAESNYGQPANPHIYGVNGGMTFTKTFADGKRPQQTFMVANLGQGARGAIALNVMGKDLQTGNAVGLDGGTLVKDVPLWETRQNSEVKLGYTVSNPTIYPVANTWIGGLPDVTGTLWQAAFIANGHKSSNATLPYDDTPALYAFNALGTDVGAVGTGKEKLPASGNAGDLLAKVSTARVGGTAGAALGTPLIVDANFSGVASIAYAGDSAGDLWRFDLRGAPSQWSAVKIYDGDPTQPITASPAVFRQNKNKFVVVFGTGSDIYPTDTLNTDQQIFAGVYDDISDTNPTALTQSSMVEQSLAENTAATPATRSLSKNLVDVSKNKGWYIPLAAGYGPATTGDITRTTSSEKVVTKAVIVRQTAYFTTRIYNTETQTTGNQNNTGETCKVVSSKSSSNGTSWLMAVDVISGSMPTTSKLKDKNGQAQDIAGYNLDALAGAVTVQPSSTLGGIEDAVDVNGGIVAGEQSITPTSDTNPVERNNDCVNSGKGYNIYTATTSTANPIVAQGITTKQCAGRMVRLNSRVIQETF